MISPEDQKNVDAILHFWFTETTAKQKYAKDDVFDALIKNKFEGLYWSVMKGNTESWRETPQGRLAEVIILDQFARNMFRGDKQSFAGDDLALLLAREALEVGDDMKLPKNQRGFFYMPFMHSESRQVHVEALKIFQEKGSEGGLKYEIKHKAIIDRFGRYPHRNEVMGRESTPEELAFLKEHGGF